MPISAPRTLAVSLSLIRLHRSRDPVIRCFAPLLPASVILLLVLLMSGVVSTSGGASFIGDWFRDASSYFFVVFLPAVALDASEKFSRRQIEVLLVTVGTAAAVWIRSRLAKSARRILGAIRPPYPCHHDSGRSGFHLHAYEGCSRT